VASRYFKVHILSGDATFLCPDDICLLLNALALFCWSRIRADGLAICSLCFCICCYSPL
jgi:hypothetical protein